MAEAVGLAASVITLVSTAYKSCKALSDTITRIDDAPKHVFAIANDLEDFYQLLGTLQAVLDNEESAAGIIEPAMSGHLSQVLRNCLEIFKATSLILYEYNDHNRSIIGISAWKRLKWTFKEKEVEETRKELTQCKLTLNMAISVANWYNLRIATAAISSRAETSSSTTEAAVTIIRDELMAYIGELEKKLPGIMEQLEDVKALQGPQPLEHDAADRSLVRKDYQFALRHYLDDAISISSGFSGPGTPSLQVSSFQATDSVLTTIYHTACTRWTSEAECTENFPRYISLFVSGMGRTALIRIDPDASVRHLGSQIEELINLPGTQLDLMYDGHIIQEQEVKLSIAGIHDNGKIKCIFTHKRPLTPPPGTNVHGLLEPLGPRSLGSKSSARAARTPLPRPPPSPPPKGSLLSKELVHLDTNFSTAKRSSPISTIIESGGEEYELMAESDDELEYIVELTRKLEHLLRTSEIDQEAFRKAFEKAMDFAEDPHPGLFMRDCRLDFWAEEWFHTSEKYDWYDHNARMLCEEITKAIIDRGDWSEALGDSSETVRAYDNAFAVANS